MPAPVHEAAPSTENSSMRTRVTAALAATSILLGASTAEAKANTARASRVQTAAQRIKDLIVHHKPVHYDPYFDAAWAFPGQKTHNYTAVPVLAKDHGHTRMFGLIQAGGHTLGSLIVKELPFEHLDVESQYDPASNCGAKPSEWGVVRLDNRYHEPVTTIRYSNGTVRRAPIGQTEFDIPGGIIGPAAMAPGTCSTNTAPQPTGGAPIEGQPTGGAPIGH